MAKRVVTKVGDVFCVKVDDNHKKYMQFIVSDMTGLNSDVVRAFKEKYPLDATPDLADIVKGEVDFYAHCVTSAGIKRGLWEKIGNCIDIGSIEHIIFKCKDDYTREDIQDDWRIWRINKEIIHIGTLEEENKKNCYLGAVFPPEDIINKLKTGVYRGRISIFE